MSLTKIMTDYRAAATRSALFTTGNVLMGYDNPFNIHRTGTSYPAVALTPPVAHVIVSGEQYRTDIKMVIADYIATGETEETCWVRLYQKADTLFNNWKLYATNSRPVSAARVTPLADGVTVDQVIGVSVEFTINVECE